MKNNADWGGCYRPRWITSSKICIILFILRKPNSIIVLLVIQNISKFVINKLTFSKTFFKTFAYFSALFHDRPYVFPWRYASKVNNIRHLNFLNNYNIVVIVNNNNIWSGGGKETRSGTEKRCSHNLQSGHPAWWSADNYSIFPTVNIFRLFRSKKRTGRGNKKCLKNWKK